MFRRREGRGSDRNNETRIVKNMTNKPITLGDIDNLEVPAGQTRDLLKFASIQRIGNSVDLLTAVKMGLLQFRNRKNKTVKSADIYDNIIPAVLEDAHENVRNVKTVTADYTLVPEDDTVVVDATATMTLPTAVGIKGYRFVVKNIKLGAVVTINVAESGTIDGELTETITRQFVSLTFMSTGSNYIIV